MKITKSELKEMIKKMVVESLNEVSTTSGSNKSLNESYRGNTKALLTFFRDYINYLKKNNYKYSLETESTENGTYKVVTLEDGSSVSLGKNRGSEPGKGHFIWIDDADWSDKVLIEAPDQLDDYIFEDGKIVQADIDEEDMDESLNESSTEALKDVVADSYRHFTKDLGRTPTISELLDDITDNYEGYEDIQDTQDSTDKWYSAISIEVAKAGLDVLDESLNGALTESDGESKSVTDEKKYFYWEPLDGQGTFNSVEEIERHIRDYPSLEVKFVSYKDKYGNYIDNGCNIIGSKEDVTKFIDKYYNSDELERIYELTEDSKIKGNENKKVTEASDSLASAKETNNRYDFLIIKAGGEALAEISVSAPNINEAYKQLLQKAFDETDEEFEADGYGDISDYEEYFTHSLDVTDGDPFVLAMKENGRIIKTPIEYTEPGDYPLTSSIRKNWKPILKYFY